MDTDQIGYTVNRQKIFFLVIKRVKKKWCLSNSDVVYIHVAPICLSFVVCCL